MFRTRSVLMERLARCDFSQIETRPTENTVAKRMSLFSRRQIAVRRWGEPTQPFKQVAFLRQVKESLSEPYPQTSRIFANEADVK